MKTGRRLDDQDDEMPKPHGDIGISTPKNEDDAKRITATEKFAWLDQVAKDYGTPDAAFRVAYIISGFLRKDKETQQKSAYPHQSLIFEKLNKSERGIRDAIEVLNKRRHLTVSTRGMKSSLKYTIEINEMSVAERTSAQEAAAGLGASGRPRQKGRPKGAQPAPPVEDATPTKPVVEMADWDEAWDPDEVSTERFEDGSPDLGTPAHEPPRLAEIIGDDGANPREILIARFMAVYPKNATGHVEGLARGGFFIQVQRGADPEAIIQAAAAYTREANEKGFYGTNRVMPPHQWLAKRPWLDAGLTPPLGQGEGDPDE